jgi:hypothetical protein
LSSGGTRGTSGEQISIVAKKKSAEERAEAIRRMRKHLRLLVGAGVAAVAVSGVVTIAILRQDAPGPAVRNVNPPALKPAPVSDPIVEPLPRTAEPRTTPAASDPGGSDASPSHTPKSKAACTPAAPTAACITGAVSPGDKAAFLAALHEAEIKMCGSDSITVVSKPSVEVKAASGIRRGKQQIFEMALRGAQKQVSFPGEVIIRCKGR